MSKPKVLIQIDSDKHPSTFDSMVAIDAGIDHLVTHGDVDEQSVVGLTHGAMFTRGPKDLNHTALFFGGSNVGVTEKLVEAATNCFFGPMRVSILSDPNGSNTTAAAAVICAEQHVDWNNKTVAILGGTGPVGQRIAKIIGGTNPAGTTIRICSRTQSKAESVCESIAVPEGCELVGFEAASPEAGLKAVENADVVFAAGAAGVELLGQEWTQQGLSVVVDLNAVPPAGISGVEVMDSGTERQGTYCYGAIGVGGLKMKIHKQAIRQLFESNEVVLRTREVYKLGKELGLK